LSARALRLWLSKAEEPLEIAVDDMLITESTLHADEGAQAREQRSHGRVLLVRLKKIAFLVDGLFSWGGHYVRPSSACPGVGTAGCQVMAEP